MQGDKRKFLWVRKLVEQSLKQPTTLVVLDGLDESAGCSKAILEEARRGTHLLLLTSRPYGVQSEQQASDLVVFHKGVSEQQMRAYV